MKIILLFFYFLFSSNIAFSQINDSINVKNEHFSFQYKKIYVPAGLMISGFLTDIGGNQSIDNKVLDFRNTKFANFNNKADDVLQFTSFAAIYGFEWIGMKPRTDWKNRTAILVKSTMINLGMVYLLKSTINETRPDGSRYSFPSGHTANAFAGATMLSIEYGENYKWVPYLAYGIASSVGLMRILNNRHYVSDVLFGAGLGILSTKIAYWTHQYKWNRKKNTIDPYEGVLYPKEL